MPYIKLYMRTFFIWSLLSFSITINISAHPSFMEKLLDATFTSLLFTSILIIGVTGHIIGVNRVTDQISDKTLKSHHKKTMVSNASIQITYDICFDALKACIKKHKVLQIDKGEGILEARGKFRLTGGTPVILFHVHKSDAEVTMIEVSCTPYLPRGLRSIYNDLLSYIGLELDSILLDGGLNLKTLINVSDYLASQDSIRAMNDSKDSGVRPSSAIGRSFYGITVGCVPIILIYFLIFIVVGLSYQPPEIMMEVNYPSVIRIEEPFYITVQLHNTSNHPILIDNVIFQNLLESDLGIVVVQTTPPMPSVNLFGQKNFILGEVIEPDNLRFLRFELVASKENNLSGQIIVRNNVFELKESIAFILTYNEPHKLDQMLRGNICPKIHMWRMSNESKKTSIQKCRI